jgi:hypothetical protein
MSFAFSMDDSRRYERDTVDCPAQIWGSTLPPSPAALINISPSGCMIRCDQLVSIGESIVLDIHPIGSLRGRAIWSGGARVGVEFEQPFSDQDYRITLMKLRAAYGGPVED